MSRAAPSSLVGKACGSTSRSSGAIAPRQRLVVPSEMIRRITSYRQACRLAWKLRHPRITQRTMAELAGLYPSHVCDYFAARSDRRELPAKHVGIVCQVLGNTVIIQYLAQSADLAYEARPIARADEVDRLALVVEQTSKTLEAALASLERLRRKRSVA